MDSGQSLTIDVTNVKKILNKFLILPFQAIECSMHKLSCPKSNNNNNVWPQKSAGKFLEMVQNASALKAKIMSKEGIKPEILVYVKIDQLTGSKQTADRKLHQQPRLYINFDDLQLMFFELPGLLQRCAQLKW